jgi:hypothetical protein
MIISAFILNFLRINFVNRVCHFPVLVCLSTLPMPRIIFYSILAHQIRLSYTDLGQHSVILDSLGGTLFVPPIEIDTLE